MSLLLSILYFFLPAYFANMMPVFMRKVPFLAYPIDFGAKIHGKRVFGQNKTLRGLVFGTAIGLFVFWLQQLGHAAGFTAYSLVEYDSLSVWLGAIMGFGALLGDLVESLFKRQLDVGPGKSLLFWDQIDFMLGAMIVTVLFWIHVWWQTFLVAALVALITVGVQRLGYILKLKDDPL